MTTKMHFQKMTRLTLLLVLLLFGAALAGCGNDGEEATEEEEEGMADLTMGEPIADSSLAAIVTSSFGSDTLTTAALEEQVAMVMQRMQTMELDVDAEKQLRRSIVEDFVMRHLLEGEAGRLGVAADTGRVAMQMGQIRGQFATEEEYQQALAQDNITEDSLRTMLRDMVRQQVLQEQMAEQAADPTEAEMTAFREEKAVQVGAQHILFLVPQGADEAQEEAIRAEAAAVLDSVKKGIDFAELAQRHSADGSAQRGGDLGYFSRGEMVPPFEKAAFALSDSGDVARDLVRTQFGYHIIRLTGRRTGELMDTTRARQMIMSERRQDAVMGEINRLRRLATVRLNPNVVDETLNVPDDLPLTSR